MKRKKIYSIVCVAAGLLTATSCGDFLETSSPSVVDGDFIFSNSGLTRSAMDGAYEAWRSFASNVAFGDGQFYGSEVTGSDIERHPEPFANQTYRHNPECFYQNGDFTSKYAIVNNDNSEARWSSAYDAIGRVNAVITAIQELPNFDEIITNATQPSEISQMYGEAVAMRASVYRELLHFWGDVPFSLVYGVPAKGLSPRDSIYDICLDQLQKVEPLMYPVGSIPGLSGTSKNYFSKTYVDGLIGRMAMDAAGYQTRRADLGADFYKSGNGTVLTFETKGKPNANAQNAVYGRRSDWRNLYTIAQTYFKKAIDNPGSAKFYTTDPRSAESGRTYGNPYQYFFEQMHEDDAQYADESIYEYPQQQGGPNDSRPYSFGRPSSGGSKDAGKFDNYPCKSYGQGRINPAFYYGLFDPKDMRRDVSCCVTGSTGKGTETLIPFTPNSKSDGGGISLNKWDENRQKTTWVAAQRKSGINGPYMRMAEMYLGYAEACAALGEDGPARQYLKIVRERSFPDGKANTDEFIASCGSVLRAVVEERGFEFAGEGDRRWTLIRTGYIADAVKRVKELTKKMLDGLESKGYYEFENGNVISSYVWTKMVDAKTLYGHRLTAQCPEGKEDDPVLYPGWRGQKDSWEEEGMKYGSSTPATNLAIKGLFKHIDPNGAEAAALEADGYTKVDWGTALVKNADEYYLYLFYNYDYESAPIYLWPFTANAVKTGGYTNGYGFRQE